VTLAGLTRRQEGIQSTYSQAALQQKKTYPQVIHRVRSAQLTGKSEKRRLRCPMSNFFFASLAILCVCSLAAALYAVRIAVRQTELPPAALRSFASKLASIEEFQAEQAETLKQLANRVKMQRVRTAINHVSDPMNADEGLTIKDQLRRRAGLVAGKPAPHKN